MILHPYGLAETLFSVQSHLLYRGSQTCVIGYEAIQIMCYHSYLSTFSMYLITSVVDTSDNAIVRYGGPEGDAL